MNRSFGKRYCIYHNDSQTFLKYFQHHWRHPHGVLTFNPQEAFIADQATVKKLYSILEVAALWCGFEKYEFWDSLLACRVKQNLPIFLPKKMIVKEITITYKVV